MREGERRRVLFQSSVTLKRKVNEIEHFEIRGKDMKAYYRLSAWKGLQGKASLIIAQLKQDEARLDQFCRGMNAACQSCN